jgi:hypothetical protein
MKKIVRLTETDLVKLIKNLIKESEPGNKPNDDVRKVVNTLEELGWIDPETTNVYEDHFEIYSIVGEQFDYFELGNFLIIDVEGEGDNINLFIRGEDYGEDDDIESKEILLDYIYENWDDTLATEDIQLFDDRDDEEYYFDDEE